MSTRPLLLDLYSGAGGAAMGYYRAGFDVVGVDIDPQPRYPFWFYQGDALEFVAKHGHEFDAIHASPPCQKYVTLQGINKAQWGFENNHPDLIPATRSALRASSKPFIIENVQGAPLETQIILCGYSMGLPKLARHRHFESNIILFGTKCTHRGREVIGVYGGLDGRRVSEKRWKTITYAASSMQQANELMGIDWMEWDELRESIPPAYTEYIGKQLIDVVLNRRAA